MRLIQARATRRRLAKELADLRVEVVDNRALLTALLRHAEAKVALRELKGAGS